MTTKSAALLLSEVLGLGHLAALEGIRDRALLPERLRYGGL